MHEMVSHNCPVSDEAMVRSGLRLKVDPRVAHILGQIKMVLKKNIPG